MTLTDIKTNGDLLRYIEGLVNDFQGVEMQSDIDDYTRKMYNDVLDLIVFCTQQGEKRIKEESDKEWIFPYSEAIEVGKVGSDQLKFITDDGFKIVKITAVQTRKEALFLMEKGYEKILSNSAAVWDFLPKVHQKNTWKDLRNYEIENALQDLGLIGYKIVEKCPINNFSFFDEGYFPEFNTKK